MQLVGALAMQHEISMLKDAVGEIKCGQRNMERRIMMQMDKQQSAMTAIIEQLRMPSAAVPVAAQEDSQQEGVPGVHAHPGRHRQDPAKEGPAVAVPLPHERPAIVYPNLSNLSLEAEGEQLTGSRVTVGAEGVAETRQVTQEGPNVIFSTGPVSTSDSFGSTRLSAREGDQNLRMTEHDPNSALQEHFAARRAAFEQLKRIVPLRNSVTAPDRGESSDWN